MFFSRHFPRPPTGGAKQPSTGAFSHAGVRLASSLAPHPSAPAPAVARRSAASFSGPQSPFAAAVPSSSPRFRLRAVAESPFSSSASSPSSAPAPRLLSVPSSFSARRSISLSSRPRSADEETVSDPRRGEEERQWRQADADREEANSAERGALAAASRLLNRAFPAAWKALERRQIESMLPRYIFDDAPPEEILLGMRIKEFNTTREEMEARRNHVDARLKALAEDSDPFALVRPDIKDLDLSLLTSIRSVYSDLSGVSSYLLTAPGKRFRPVILLLLRRALMELPKLSRASSRESETRALERGAGLELCMVQVAELIHTASMMHDDVIDGADTRRGQMATHKRFGNKTAILGGDFLLSRANGIVATCGSPEVMLRMSSVIESLVKGELIQAISDSKDLDTALRTYLIKTYHKTASLIAESCACLALLMGMPPRWAQWSFDFGACVGMAFQLYDDELDFTASSKHLGKPALSDLRSGVITAPLLMAALEEEERGLDAREAHAILLRRAQREGDVEKAINLIFAGNAMPRAQLLGRMYVHRAIELLEELTVATGASASSLPSALALKAAEQSEEARRAMGTQARDAPEVCRALAALLQATLQRRSG
ncbi:polyprenyl synthetase superfamily protein [Besnoitia besnoiti]|uniref:Polyprenyl synthetase superfamily protein n=1 Tax=Besnoitia besnoiti TaxID=94643 RepID=A0A2A9MIY8_BESBE|nr:polyprenyl synthetase superfamily protein [Besnoitia besnoiti]PFH35613.1 polyprenyl synthetase superfamily protein [Besnoitia besnoiti]